MRKVLSIISIIFILTGCTVDEIPTKLMEVPTNESWLKELKVQMNKDLPINYRLLTPISNKDKQMIWTLDMDQDGKKEAVFLYKQPHDDYQVYLSIYKQTSEGWQSQLTHTFTGEGVDIVKIGDFTGNHKKEILIGISQGREASVNDMHALSIENNSMTEIYNRNYTKLFVDDLNENGIDDLSFVTYEQDQQLKVEFMEKFKTLSEVSFDPSVNNIQKVQIGRISKQMKAIFIDAGLGAHSGLTYVAKFEDNHFEKLFQDEENMPMSAYVVESKDINGDGIIELGNTIVPKGWEESSYAESPMFERYVQWDGENEFKPVEEVYINIEQGYIIEIPKELVGKITLATKTSSKNIQRFLWADTGETWLEVHTFKRKEWPNIKNYEVAVKTSSRIYAVPNESKYKKLKSYIKPLAEYQQE
ncbi:lipoprotein [Bacillus sp. 166amftsu]|uniref:lipoprotein n=1 Tax=Bacillus sp. 166amftsu TaxID=1761753 RepID=UPI000898F012|nr:lipoprotein [Bacillus sp. 166amftsu]SDY96743.1 hypothetical protein SAMN04488156_103279 [Bacillus sp. 166amftsu]